MAQQTDQSSRRGVFHSQPLAVPDPVSTLMPHLQRSNYQYFWAALIGGIGVLIGLSYETVTVHSVALEVFFVAGGSLLVPSLYVYYLDLRNRFIEPTWRTLVWTFTLGAFLGAPIAVTLEALLGTGVGAPLPAFGTGLVEEFAKAVAVLWLLRKKHRDLSFEMDGIIIGAAAGMGFAALEDILYGASAFNGGLTGVVVTVWLRAILGPFGHGTWTAIVAGTIWREKGAGAPRLTRRVVGAYLLAATLHGLWDWDPLPGLSALVWLLGVGAVGVAILRKMIHEALAQEQAFIDRSTANLMASCPRCGSTSGPRARFCGNCGGLLPPPET